MTGRRWQRASRRTPAPSTRACRPAVGYQAIEDTCRATLTPLTASQHLIGNVTVTLDGDAADCVSYLQAQHVKTGTPGGDNFIIAGRYRDRFVRTDEGWRIQERRLDGMWTAGNPAVLESRAADQVLRAALRIHRPVGRHPGCRATSGCCRSRSGLGDDLEHHPAR